MSNYEDQMISRIWSQSQQILSRLSEILSFADNLVMQNQELLNNQKLILNLLSKNGDAMTDTATFIQTMNDKLTNMESVEDSAITLIDGLIAEVAANKNNPAALDALLARMDADKAKLATAVLANTSTTVVPPVINPAPISTTPTATDSSSTTNTGTTDSTSTSTSSTNASQAADSPNTNS